ncbi:MAG: hypothetical protein ACXWC3_31455 [Burkholderiales bacterium]
MQVKFVASVVASAARHRTEGASKMLDVILLGLGLGFFVLTIGYAYACDRL